jgi:hypothetical protein
MISSPELRRLLTAAADHLTSSPSPRSAAHLRPNSSGVFDSRAFHRQRGDGALDEDVEAGGVLWVRLGCFEVAAGEDLGVQEVDEALFGCATSDEGS